MRHKTNVPSSPCLVRQHPKNKNQTSKTKPKNKLVPQLSQRRQNATQHFNRTRLEHHKKQILGNRNPNLEITVGKNKSTRLNKRIRKFNEQHPETPKPRNPETPKYRNPEIPSHRLAQRYPRQNQIHNKQRNLHKNPRSPRLLVRIRSNDLRPISLPIRKQRLLRKKFPSTIRSRIHRTNPSLVLLHDDPIRNPLRQNPFRERPNNRNHHGRRRTKNVKVPTKLSRPTRSHRKIRSRHSKILHVKLASHERRKLKLLRKNPRRNLQKNHNPTLQRLKFLPRLPTTFGLRTSDFGLDHGSLDHLKNRKSQPRNPKKPRRIQHRKSLRLHKKIHRRPINMVHPKLQRPIQRRRQNRKRNPEIRPRKSHKNPSPNNSIYNRKNIPRHQRQKQISPSRKIPKIRNKTNRQKTRRTNGNNKRNSISRIKRKRQKSNKLKMATRKSNNILIDKIIKRYARNNQRRIECKTNRPTTDDRRPTTRNIFRYFYHPRTRSRRIRQRNLKKNSSIKKRSKPNQIGRNRIRNILGLRRQTKLPAPLHPRKSRRKNNLTKQINQEI